jgi:hypothetical protein
VACSPENRVSFVAFVDSVSPHLSIVDVLPLKRKELREYIFLCLRLPPRGFLVPLLVSYLHLVVCLLVTCREIHLAAHLENLPLCQA